MEYHSQCKGNITYYIDQTASSFSSWMKQMLKLFTTFFHIPPVSIGIKAVYKIEKDSNKKMST